MTLEGRLIRLRAVEPDDVDVLYAWENDPAIWAVSGTTEPFSREQILRFVERQLEGRDLFRSGQLRLMIEARGAAKKDTREAGKKDTREEAAREPEGASACFSTVGTVDLFEYDPLHGRAGLGILIYGEENRQKGYARDTVETLCRYARERLRMHQLWCGITSDNEASLRLFRTLGFSEAGTRRDWLWSPEGYRDEILFQKILD